MGLLEAALAEAGEDDRLRVQIESELTFAAGGVGQLAGARAYAESALRTAERLGDPQLVARALAELLLTSVTTGEPLRDDLLSRCSEVEDSATTTAYYQLATAVGLARNWAGDFEGARPALEQAAQRALSRGEEWDRMTLEFTLAQLEWELGNPPAAERHRQAAEEAMGEFVDGLPWLVVLDATSALRGGDSAAARATLEEGVAQAEPTGEVWKTSHFTSLLGWVELLSSHPETAHARLRSGASGYSPSGTARLGMGGHTSGPWMSRH